MAKSMSALLERREITKQSPSRQRADSLRRGIISDEARSGCHMRAAIY